MALLVVLGCGCTGPGTSRPADIYEATLPDTLAAGRMWTLHVYARLGTNLCWGFGSAGLERRGDSLVARVIAHNDGGQQVCPQAISERWVSMLGPALGAGRYILVAGNLADTVTVSAGAESPPIHVMASGSIDRSGAPTKRFVTLAHEVYRIANPETLPDVAVPGRIYGTRVDGTEPTLQVRRFEYLPD